MPISGWRKHWPVRHLIASAAKATARAKAGETSGFLGMLRRERIVERKDGIALRRDRAAERRTAREAADNPAAAAPIIQETITVISIIFIVLDFVARTQHKRQHANRSARVSSV